MQAAVHCATVATLLLSTGAIADPLAPLSPGERAAVERLCLPVQYSDGAAAYRDCVTNRIEAGFVEQPGTTALSFDEAFVITQTCSSSGNPDSEAFRQCANAEAGALLGLPIPDFTALNEDEKFALQRQCAGGQFNSDVRALRTCLNDGINQLSSIAVPDLSALTQVERNVLQLSCAQQGNSAADLRSCLLAAVDGAALATVQLEVTSSADATSIDNAAAASLDTSPTATETPTTATEAVNSPDDQLAVLSPAAAEPVTAEPATTEPVTAAPETRSADQPVTNESVSTAVVAEPIQPGNNSALIRDSEIDSSTPPSTLTAVLARSRNMLVGLNGMDRLIMMAAAALPFILLGFWLLMKGRRSEPAYAMPAARNAESDELINRVGAPRRHRTATRYENQPDLSGHRPVRQSTARPSSTAVDHHQTASQATAPDTKRQAFAEQVDELFAESEADEIEEIEEIEAIAPIISAPKPRTENDGYLAWLTHHDEEVRLSLATEFLIYWMAYGDERYEPELRRKIFTMQDPDDHDLIKRWVLKQDIYAFADTVSWLQINASEVQKEQVIRLLMALLINENAVTPVQNTLLRFLGDALAFNKEQLEVMFEKAYGHPMPSLPRTDKPKWWQTQPEDSLKRWDARSISRQSRDIQGRIKLGLPFSDEISEQDINDAFDRANTRCHASHFTQLTARERMLAERQLEKFALARDALLEVSA